MLDAHTLAVPFDEHTMDAMSKWGIVPSTVEHTKYSTILLVHEAIMVSFIAILRVGCYGSGNNQRAIT